MDSVIVEDYKILKGKSDRELGEVVRQFFEQFEEYEPLGAPFTSPDEWGALIWHQAVVKYNLSKEEIRKVLYQRVLAKNILEDIRTDTGIIKKYEHKETDSETGYDSLD